MWLQLKLQSQSCHVWQVLQFGKEVTVCQKICKRFSSKWGILLPLFLFSSFFVHRKLHSTLTDGKVQLPFWRINNTSYTNTHYQSCYTKAAIWKCVISRLSKYTDRETCWRVEDCELPLTPDFLYLNQDKQGHYPSMSLIAGIGWEQLQCHWLL